MQFITDGPDIPNALLEAHEEGRVVFFCGAGISYPAGLPGFGGLVEKIYEHIGTQADEIECQALAKKQFDAALDRLEHRVQGQRLTVRKALASALKPKLRRKGATESHEALLHLARSREGALRLVTTNFDLVFDHAAQRIGKPFNTYAAPMLPIPKSSRWNGLVYLHGKLPQKFDETALQRLVVTSGDFGLAYLTERWASRFVSELFSNYVVCFVGYSINDPVLRYMMDALAADRLLGETTPQAYAIGDCTPGREEQKTVEWEAKGVKPILYSDSNKHAALHRTLKKWAETYRDGVLGKERIVVEHALAKPSASTQQDDFVGRMLWALSDPSGLPAKRFAELSPPPPLEWLDAFAESRYRHIDLSRFNVQPSVEVDEKLEFSLIRRPTPYRNSPWMRLASMGATDTQLDPVMFHLARWLVKHLNDPALIIWLLQQGGVLHERCAFLIGHELDRLAEYERTGDTAKLDEIRAGAPKAIPSSPLRQLWSLFLSGRVKTASQNLDFYRWSRCLKNGGLTTLMRLELRELLAPKIVLRKRFNWGSNEQGATEPTRLQQIVDWEMALADNHVHHTILDNKDEAWFAAQPDLLDDYQHLLRDALDLQRELGEANDRRDHSYWDMPSISEHWQNRGYRDWVALIALLRDAWLATRKVDPKKASSIAQVWFGLPYPTFKRLALFAASQEACLPTELWVEWLTADGAWWLWSLETKRETMRLLVLQAGKLSPLTRANLESAILAGPPRSMYREELEYIEWKSLVEHSIWQHLAKLHSGGGQLGIAATQRLNELSSTYPDWKLAANQSDEFSHWMSGTGDPDYEERRHIDNAPLKLIQLVEWLKQPEKPRNMPYEDNWRDICKNHPMRAGCALTVLAAEEMWPVDRWSDIFHMWADRKLQRRVWRRFSPTLTTMPNEVLQQIATSATWWIKKVAESASSGSPDFLALCKRVLDLQLKADTGMTRNGAPIDSPVMEAINHPVGHITEALITLWLTTKPNDRDLLPPSIEPLFTLLCDTKIDRFRHGRTILASRLISLFRVDEKWTERHLLPLFDWEKIPIEAKSAWEGFLWSPRIYSPLLLEFKHHFLETAGHYTELGEHGRAFASFLTYAALDPSEGFNSQDYQEAVAALPADGLQEVAHALANAQESSAEQREDYWKNRIKPFWQHCWPKSKNLASRNIARHLTLLCIATRGEFSSAFETVKDWLEPLEHPSYEVGLLNESGLCNRFPEKALALLAAIIKEQDFWTPSELKDCLEAITKANPKLRANPHYVRLAEYVRKRES